MSSVLTPVEQARICYQALAPLLGDRKSRLKMRCTKDKIRIQVPLPIVTMMHPSGEEYVFDDMYAVIYFYLDRYYRVYVIQRRAEHPHSYGEGKLCIGDYESKFLSLLKSGDYVSLYAKLCACANTYTPHDVVQASWAEGRETSCDECGDLWDEEDLEEVDDGDLLCEYCRMFCHHLGCLDYIRRSDYNLCSECGEHFCSYHQRCCPSCGVTLCEDCECSSCQGDENE